jgi:Mitochondrial carrier protein
VPLAAKAERLCAAFAPHSTWVLSMRCACSNPWAAAAVQTRLMAQQKSADGSRRYSGFLDALVKIPREEGLRAMWKGLLPRLMRIPPGQAIVWAVSDQITGYCERFKATPRTFPFPSPNVRMGMRGLRSSVRQCTAPSVVAVCC